MTSLSCLAVHWDEMCPGWLHHPHGHSPGCSFVQFRHLLLEASSSPEEGELGSSDSLSSASLTVVCLMVQASTYLAGCWIDGCVCNKIQALGSNILCPGGSIWCRLQRFSPSACIHRTSKGLSAWSFPIWGKVSLPAYLLGTRPAYLAFGSLGFLRSRLWCRGNSPTFSLLGRQFLGFPNTILSCIFGICV